MSRQRWAVLDPTHVAGTCSPEHVRNVLLDAKAEIAALYTQRDALLAALGNLLSYTAEFNPNQGFDELDHPAVKQAFEAIAKAQP